MRERRMTWAAAERIAVGLSKRDWDILESLARCRVLTGHHLQRLHFHDLKTNNQDRLRRRVLARLTELLVLATLERRIGGARAGSAGLVFALGPAGQRLRSLQANASAVERTRQPHTPTVRFMSHSLAISELYVQLVEQSRSNQLTLVSFRTEPDCWWLDAQGNWVKPDAVSVVRAGDIEDAWAIEVDMATESLPTLRRKLRAYLALVDQGAAGPDDRGLPRVLLAASTIERATAIRRLVAELPEPASELFAVETLAQAVARVVRDVLEGAASPERGSTDQEAAWRQPP